MKISSIQAEESLFGQPELLQVVWGLKEIKNILRDVKVATIDQMSLLAYMISKEEDGEIKIPKYKKDFWEMERDDTPTHFVLRARWKVVE